MPEPSEQPAGTTTLSPWFRFARGAFHAAPVFYIAFVVPYVVNRFFYMGLKGVSLVVAVSIFPFMVIASAMVAMKEPARRVMGLVASVLAAIFTVLGGFLFAFEPDSSSIPAITIMVCMLLAGFVASLSEYTRVRQGGFRTSPEEHARQPGWIEAAGTSAAVLVPGAIQVASGTYLVAFIAGAVLFAIAPLQDLVPGAGHGDSTRKVPRAEFARVPLRVGLASVAALLLFCISIFTLGVSIYTSYQPAAAGIAFMGFAVGFACAGIRRGMRIELALAFSGGLLLGGFSMAVLGVPLNNVVLGFIEGLAAGFAAGVCSWLATMLPPSRHGSKVALQALGITILNAILAAVASQVGWFISLLIPVGLAVIGTVSVLAIIAAVVSIPIAGRIASFDRERPAGEPWHAFTARYRSIAKACAVVTLISVPSLAVAIQLTSGQALVVVLPSTMYDVNGNPITTVDLAPISGKILFYSPHPANGTVHDELIRKGMSVRLGGYYYGFSEPGMAFTKNDVINWVANNDDVFSFGFCGNDTKDPWSINPGNITAIRTINPRVRVYYQAYGTTLFQDPASNNTGPTWGDTHYPEVGFNSTIESFTVKLANGSEAYGMHHSPSSKYVHLMDLGNPGWARYFAWIYENRCAQFHANGVAIDEITWGGYWNVDTMNGGEPLANYSSGAQVTNACYSFLQGIRSRMHVDIISQANWPQALQYQNGIWGEIAFSSTGGNYGSTTSARNDAWQQAVDIACTIGSKNESYIWGAWYDRGSNASLEYAIATYLMAKPNNCRSLVFAPQPIYNGGYPANLAGYAVKTVADQVASKPQYFNIQLGDALGNMTLKTSITGQYYERDFQNGIVLVNPYHGTVFGI